MERGREWYESDTGCFVEAEVCADGDLIRYEFADKSAIVVAESCWDIEGEEKFSFASYT